MVVLEIDKERIKKEFKGKTQVSYSFVEKIVLKDFLRKMLEDSLKKDGFKKDKIEDFILSYLESFDKNNLVNI